eukprot:2425046-Alexandrium_andersonii.AAC.1
MPPRMNVLLLPTGWPSCRRLRTWADAQGMLCHEMGLPVATLGRACQVTQGVACYLAFVRLRPWAEVQSMMCHEMGLAIA